MISHSTRPWLCHHHHCRRHHFHQNHPRHRWHQQQINCNCHLFYQKQSQQSLSGHGRLADVVIFTVHQHRHISNLNPCTLKMFPFIYFVNVWSIDHLSRMRRVECQIIMRKVKNPNYFASQKTEISQIAKASFCNNIIIAAIIRSLSLILYL